MSDQTEDTEDDLMRAFARALFGADQTDETDEKPADIATTERPGRGLFAPTQGDES
jgi:hypothetical protein